MSKQQRKRQLLVAMIDKIILYLPLIGLGALSYFFLADNPVIWLFCVFLWEHLTRMIAHMDVSSMMNVELFLLAHIMAFIEIYKFIREAASSPRDPKEKLEAQESLMHTCSGCSTLPYRSDKKLQIHKQKMTQ